MPAEIIRPEIRAARAWIARTPTVEIGEALMALLVDGPPTATEASIAPAVAAWLCDRYDLSMCVEAEVDELRARVAQLEAVVEQLGGKVLPGGMVALPVRGMSTEQKTSFLGAMEQAQFGKPDGAEPASHS